MGIKLFQAGGQKNVHTAGEIDATKLAVVFPNSM
jgi:hypothetical protein